MKLGELNTAIRKMSGAPKANLRYHPDGREDVELFDLEITKKSLLDAIKRQFPEGGRSTETGLRLKADGHIVATSDDDVEEAAPAGEPDALDDVLG